MSLNQVVPKPVLKPVSYLVSITRSNIWVALILSFDVFSQFLCHADIVQFLRESEHELFELLVIHLHGSTPRSSYRLLFERSLLIAMQNSKLVRQSYKIPALKKFPRAHLEALLLPTEMLYS